MLDAIRTNWRIYLIEAWALGMFMLSAVLFVVLIEHPDLPVRPVVTDAFTRRLLVGLAMGLTAVVLIESNWGKRSGAHMNPAVTLAFLRLGRIKPADAFWYILAQFAGGATAVFLLKWSFMPYVAAPEINYIITIPGSLGVWVALGLEALLSFLLLLTVLYTGNHTRLTRYTPYFVGLLLTIFIALEAPYSGMSINPARTAASALPSGIWTSWWIYLIGPVLGMQLSGWVFTRMGKNK